MENNNNKDKTVNEVKVANRPKAADLRKLAQDIRTYAAEIENIKMIKSAKYIVGLTSLITLRNKLRSL